MKIINKSPEFYSARDYKWKNRYVKREKQEFLIKWILVEILTTLSHFPDYKSCFNYDNGEYMTYDEYLKRII